MRLPLKPMALSAAAMSTRRATGMGPSDYLERCSVLMSAPGLIQMAEFDGSGFTTTLNASISGSPSWVEFVKPDKLFVVDEAGTDMRLFCLSGADGPNPTLSEPLATATGSSGNVHLAFNPDMTRMISAAYGQGTIDVWDISGDSISLVKTIDSAGDAPEGRHPHQSVLDPTGRYFIVNDLGSNALVFIDTSENAANGPWEVLGYLDVTGSGCGPRHGAFYTAPGAGTSDEATHYIWVCEKSNEVLTVPLKYEKNSLSAAGPIVSVSTFVGDVPEGAAAGELAISPDGKHLYVSNRLTGADQDTIAHFTITDGKVDIVAETPSGGKLPRMFSIDPSGKTLYVANQGGQDAVSVFDIADDGSLVVPAKATRSQSSFPSGENMGPTWIKKI